MRWCKEARRGPAPGYFVGVVLPEEPGSEDVELLPGCFPWCLPFLCFPDWLVLLLSAELELWPLVPELPPA